MQEDNDSTFKKQSFVPPHLEVGDIFEFQYLIKLNPGYYAPSVYIDLQQEEPIRKVDVRIRPTKDTQFTSRYKWTSYRTNGKNLKKTAGGFFVMQLENLPAYPYEPLQIRGRNEKSWSVFYHSQSDLTGKRFWKNIANKLLTKTKWPKRS